MENKGGLSGAARPFVGHGLGDMLTSEEPATKIFDLCVLSICTMSVWSKMASVHPVQSAMSNGCPLVLLGGLV